MDKCQLPGCNNRARRKFCCNKHKDRYHNLTNPRGRFAYLARGSDDNWLDHPFASGPEGHGQE